MVLVESTHTISAVGRVCNRLYVAQLKIGADQTSAWAKAARRKQQFTKMCINAGVTPDLSFESFKVLVQDDKRFKKVRKKSDLI